jgi:SAM-dependent methyltransferase
MTLAVHLAAPDWLRQLEGGPAEVLWNLRGIAKGWRDHPRSMDFLRPDSPNFAWKHLQTRIYFEALASELPGPEEGPLHILDAACGIGRMLVPLAGAGHQLTGVDACLESLQAAAAHASGLATQVQLTWDDIATTPLAADTFDRVLALELLCYLPNPSSTLARLAAALKPGGTLIASVEAWPGALLSWPERPPPSTVAKGCVERNFSAEDDLWVHPMEASELAAILQSADLEVLRLEPVHFFADGPLADHVDLDRLGQAVYDDQLIEWERGLRADPALAGLSRAWLTVARKKDL